MHLHDASTTLPPPRGPITLKKMSTVDYTSLSTGTESPSLSRSLSRGARAPILSIPSQTDKDGGSRSSSRERKVSERKIKTAENSAPITHTEHSTSIIKKLSKKKKECVSEDNSSATDDDNAPSLEQITKDVLYANTRLDEINRSITKFFTVIETQQTMLREIPLEESDTGSIEEVGFLDYYCCCCYGGTQ